MEDRNRVDKNWRRRWLVGGVTPYYYYYPRYLHGPLRESYYTSRLGLLSIFFWFIFLASFVVWWWIDWFFIISIVFFVLIIIQCGGMFAGMTYLEGEAKKDATQKNDTDANVEGMKPTKMKSSTELKSLKMQL